MDSNNEKPFAVVRFFETPVDDNQYFEVGLASWIVTDLDDEMVGEIKWPPRQRNATPLIKLQSPYDENWDSHKVQVMRFYESFVLARSAVPKFIADSNHDTETELSNKRRRIRPSRLDSSSSEDDLPVRKRSKATIPAPPPISSKKVPKAGRKGQGPSKSELNKLQREEVMKRLAAARAAAAAKMAGSKSPWKVTKTPEKVPSHTSGISLDKTPEKSMSTPRRSPVKTPGTTPVKTPGKSPVITVSSPTTSAVKTPWKSPLQTPVKSPHHDSRAGSSLELMDVSQFLDMELTEEDPDNPAEVVPTVKSFSELPDNQAFYLSPASAAACSKSLLARQPSSAPRQPSSASSQPNSAPSQPSSAPSQPSSAPSQPNSAPRQPSSAPSQPGRSQVDGRRRLFALQSDNKALDEKLSAIQSSLLALEVLMRETSAKTDVGLMNLGRLQRCLLPSEKRICKPVGMPKIPLGTKDELNNFEEFLGKSDANLAGMCDYLSNYIRSQVADPERKSALAILSKLLYNNLAKEINLDGGNGKIAFRSLNIFKAFEGTLQTAFPQSDLSNATKALSDWLKDAKWRKQMPTQALPQASSSGASSSRASTSGASSSRASTSGASSSRASSSGASTSRVSSKDGKRHHKYADGA